MDNLNFEEKVKIATKKFCFCTFHVQFKIGGLFRARERRAIKPVHQVLFLLVVFKYNLSKIYANTSTGKTLFRIVKVKFLVCKFYVMLLLLFVMTFCYNADLISCALHYVFVQNASLPNDMSQ